MQHSTRTTATKASSRKSTNGAFRSQTSREETVVIAQKKLPLCMNFLNMLFYWMAERDRIRRKRQIGSPPPWTKDATFCEHKFCNVYRAYDRGTQYILREVINKGSQDHQEICFRVILFKLFNRIATWEYLKKRFGSLTWAQFDVKAYGTALAARKETSPLYTSAYQIPAPKLGEDEGFKNHLRLLQLMMENDLPAQLLQRTHIRDAHKLIELYPGMGQFLSFQLILDLNMSPHLNYSENEWVACGPGSKGCLRMIFGDGVSGVESDAIAYLHSTQEQHFKRLRIDDPPRFMSNIGVSFVDIEHSLCECFKYYRALGVRGSWKASDEPITHDVPVKTQTGMTITELIPATATPCDTVESSRAQSLDTDGENDDTNYEVSHIVSERLGSGGREYKVRWTGYGPKDDLWLPEKELQGAQDVLKEWRALRCTEDRIHRRVKTLVEFTRGKSPSWPKN